GERSTEEPRADDLAGPALVHGVLLVVHLAGDRDHLAGGAVAVRAARARPRDVLGVGDEIDGLHAGAAAVELEGGAREIRQHARLRRRVVALAERDRPLLRAR